MKLRISHAVGFLSLVLSLVQLPSAQTPNQSSSALPRLVRFSGVVRSLNGDPLTGVVGITLALYSEQTGGAPLWLETQNVTADSNGHYTVLLGSTKPEGLPPDVFTSEQARWIGVQVSGQAEQTRILLVSVPYALKASDADTLGGKPASSYLLVPEVASGTESTMRTIGKTATASGTPAKATNPAIGGSGTANYIPMFTDSSGDIGNSSIYQSSTGNVGIGYNSPNARLLVSVPAGGAALNSTNLTDQDMQINLTAPGATDKHAYFGTSTPTNLTLGVGGIERMRITNSGNIGIGYSAPTNARVVIGAPSGGSVLNSSNLTDQDMFITLTAPGASDKKAFFGPSTPTNLALGVGLTEMMRITNSGRVGIGTSTPAATLDVNGNVNAATSYQLAGAAFAYGSFVSRNAFTGFAGNSTMTGGSNLASGYLALQSNTTGQSNTAVGEEALELNTTANGNTAVGSEALWQNTTGYQNTSIGLASLFGNTTGFYNTAVGANTLAGNTTSCCNTAIGFDALAFGTGGVFGSNTAVGYQTLFSNTTGNSNTATGAAALTSNTTGIANTAIGNAALLANSTGSNNTAVGNFAFSLNTTGSFLTCIGNSCGTTADNLSNATAIGAHAMVGESNALVLGGTGSYAVKVGIGTATPSNILTIAQGAGQPLSDGWATFSSRRWKTNIQTLQGALTKIEQLRGVSYDLKANGQHEVGVIAEEVGTVVPEVVTWEKDGKDARSVDYGRLTALLIEATKEQQALIRRQQELIARLTRQVKTIQSTLKANARSGSAVRTINADGTAAPLPGRGKAE